MMRSRWPIEGQYNIEEMADRDDAIEVADDTAVVKTMTKAKAKAKTKAEAKANARAKARARTNAKTNATATAKAKTKAKAKQTPRRLRAGPNTKATAKAS